MRHLVSFIVVILCSFSVQSLPLPDVIQYSVPSKFFNQNGSKSSSFYDILKQIHFGGSSGGNAAATETTSSSLPSLDPVAMTISNEKIDTKNDEPTMTPMEMDVTNSNESPEAPVVTDDVTDRETKEHHQHEIDTTMKDNSADNDESFTALIEKVVSKQIEKLASEFDTENKINLPNEQNEVIEKSDLEHESNAMSNTEKAQLDNDKDDHVDGDADDDDRVSETTTAINSEIAIAEDEKTEEKEDEIVATTTAASGMSIIESVDLDSESESTIVPTNPPEQTTNMETILADNVHEEHKDDAELNGETFIEEDEKVSEETSSKNEIPEALLNAVGDLLSSVLGVSVTSIKNGLFIPTADATTTSADNIENENIHTDSEGSAATENDIVEHSTEQDLSSSTSALEFNENNGEEEIKTEATDVVQNNESEIDTSVVTMPQESDAGTIVNEIDLKIENLGNVHDTNFMTEDTPEVYTESVKEPEMPSSDDIKTEITILEAMPAMTVEEEDSMKPVSFEESVNHIMNLVKDTEDRLELENAQNIIDSVLIDQNTVHNSVNHILKSALKEIETNFGMNEQEIEKEIQIPTDALEMLDQEREEMIKNFETDINESLIDSSIDQEDIYEPNMAKAALFHKFQYDDDF